MLPAVRQEVCDQPVGGFRDIQLGELFLKESEDDGVEGRAEVHKQHPGVGCRCVQVNCRGSRRGSVMDLRCASIRRSKDFITTEVRAKGL